MVYLRGRVPRTKGPARWWPWVILVWLSVGALLACGGGTVAEKGQAAATRPEESRTVLRPATVPAVESWPIGAGD